MTGKTFISGGAFELFPGYACHALTAKGTCSPPLQRKYEFSAGMTAHI
jgi:hypothetical protein